MKKKYEQLKKELIEKQELIDRLEKNNERMDLILTDWIKDYSFNEDPNPNRAKSININNSNYYDKENTIGKCEDSTKWYKEYGRIKGLVNVAMDYVKFSKYLINKNGGTENVK